MEMVLAFCIICIEIPTMPNIVLECVKCIEKRAPRTTMSNMFSNPENFHEHCWNIHCEFVRDKVVSGLWVCVLNSPQCPNCVTTLPLSQNWEFCQIFQPVFDLFVQYLLSMSFLSTGVMALYRALEFYIGFPPSFCILCTLLYRNSKAPNIMHQRWKRLYKK